MKLKAMIGDVEKDIEVRRDGALLFASIDGHEREFEISEPEVGIYLFKTPDGVYEAYVSPEDSQGLYEVTVSNETFGVSLFDPKRMRGIKPGTRDADGLVEIRSAMPGKVVTVIACVGDRISSGDGVVVVEAMKMQNELKSPKDGVVKEILVKEEDRVNSGDVLVVIE